MLYKDFSIIQRDSFSTKLIFGIGINDADYKIQPYVDGKQVTCPIYARWRSMIQRCYQAKFHIRQPTYADCIVDERWHSLMAFRAWVLAQPEWEGLQLDKDILFLDNRVYGPDTCILIPRELNTFLTNINKSSSGLPVGVAKK